MKWIGKRTSFIDQKNKCTIVIYPDNVFWEKGLMSAWFCMWLVIGATMTWSFSLNLTRQETLIVVIFLAFWAYYATKVGRSLFWLLWGKELIKIDKSGLTLKKSIKGFGKSNTYFLENIQKCDYSFPKENSFQAIFENSPWIQKAERIEFAYIGKSVRFGRKLNEKDCKLILSLIVRRIEYFTKQINQ